MKNIAASTLAALALLLPLSTNAQETAPEPSSSVKFQFGLNYIGGFSNLIDVYEEYGYESDYEVPFGLNFMVRQEFSSGLGWDINIGPVILIEVEYDEDDDSEMNWLIPLEGDVRYTFIPEANASLYVRGGIRALIASGDDFDSDGVGFGAGVGVEFNRNRAVSYGIEASYNSARVKFNNYGEDTVKPYEFCVAFYTAF